MSSLKRVSTLTVFYIKYDSCSEADEHLDTGDMVIVLGTNPCKRYEIMCITRFGIGFIHGSHAQ